LQNSYFQDIPPNNLTKGSKHLKLPDVLHDHMEVGHKPSHCLQLEHELYNKHVHDLSKNC
jgi:hypothetical protein